MTGDEQEVRFKSHSGHVISQEWRERLSSMLEALPGECDSDIVADLLWGICARLTQDTPSLLNMFERSMHFLTLSGDAVDELQRQRKELAKTSRKRFEEDSVANYRIQMLGDLSGTYR